MNVTLLGSSRSAPVLLAGGFRNMFVSASSGDRTYTAAKAASLDFTRDRRAMPYDSLAVIAIVEPFQRRVSEDGIFSGTAAELKALETRLIQVTKANEEYITEVTSYYGARVSRTSGGKRARLRDERAILRNEADKAIKVAQAAMMDLRSLKIAEYKGAATTDPDNVVVTRNPESGRIEYRPAAATPGTTAATRETKPAGKFPTEILLIPVGIAAAYFFAKG